MGLKKQTSKKPTPSRTKDLPATRSMLFAVRDELKQEFRRHDARFDEHDARFDEHDKRFDQIDAKFEQFDAKFKQFDAKLERTRAELNSSLSRIELLVEEQNANNKIVLEGLQALIQRQDRLEIRVDSIEQTVRVLAKNKDT